MMSEVQWNQMPSEAYQAAPAQWSSIQLPPPATQEQTEYYQQGNLNPSHLPHIQSIMMKTEQKEENQLAYRTTAVVYPPGKTDPDGYQPMHDTMIDFYGSGLTADFSFNPLNYTATQISYDSPQVQIISDLPYYQPEFISTPVVTSTSSEPIASSRIYYDEIGQSSPNYSPPPQDPLVVKPKKRIPAVPCHSNSICANCKTKETTLWRRNHVGEIECNACNLYFRKNNRKRPLSLKKDGILKRNRKPRCESPITRPRS